MTPDEMTFRIILPLPDRTLSPNSRVCWQAKARATKAFRSLAFFVSQRFPTRWKSATAQALFYFPDSRRRDRDNLLSSLKAAFDGIAAAGVVEDDSQLTHLPVQIAKDPTAPRVEIFLRRIE